MGGLKFKVNVKKQIFKKLSRQFYFLSEFLREICQEEVAKVRYFRGQKRSLTSNKSIYYPLQTILPTVYNQGTRQVPCILRVSFPQSAMENLIDILTFSLKYQRHCACIKISTFLFCLHYSSASRFENDVNKDGITFPRTTSSYIFQCILLHLLANMPTFVYRTCFEQFNFHIHRECYLLRLFVQVQCGYAIECKNNTSTRLQKPQVNKMIN